MSKGLDKYLQDTEQCCALEVNYFDDTTRYTNIASMSEALEKYNESSKYNLSSAKQESMEEAESAVNIPESLKGIPHDVHHSLVQTQTKNVNNIHHQDMWNKMQWNIRLTMSIQLKMPQ